MTTPYHRDIRLVVAHPITRLGNPSATPPIPEVAFDPATELSGWKVSIGVNAPGPIEYTPVGGDSVTHLRPYSSVEAIIPDVPPGSWAVAIEWFDQFDQGSPFRTSAINIQMPQPPSDGDLVTIELVPLV